MTKFPNKHYKNPLVYLQVVLHEWKLPNLSIQLMLENY